MVPNSPSSNSSIFVIFQHTRVDIYRCGVVSYGAVEITYHQKHLTTPAVCFVIIRVEPDGIFKINYRLIEVPQFTPHTTSLSQHSGAFRAKCKRLVEVNHC